MLTQINLHHFKCFEILKLPLSPLTLLTGTNSSGKSSVLQALVLLHQTVCDHEWSTRLMLNGRALRLGAVADVVDQITGRDTFTIELWDNHSYYSWEFQGERDDLSMEVKSVRADGGVEDKPNRLHFLLPYTTLNIDTVHDEDLIISREPASEENHLLQRIKRLTYITAERLGPREVYTLEDLQTASTVGTAGEYTASVLYSNLDEKVLPELLLPDTTPTLRSQVDERMRTFFPGCEISLYKPPQFNAVLLGLRTGSDTNFHRPVNVGFGLTQVLPIVVAALTAKQGDILLIENPEVHLHPAGQAKMGQFLADVAKVGVQVIIETHSDHILNGIRRAVKSGRLSHDQASIHFFTQRSAEGPQVINPVMDREGNIDTWPDGFFDQFDKDTNYFAGWGE